LDVNNPLIVGNISRYARHYDIAVDGNWAYLASNVWSTIYEIESSYSPTFGWDIDIGSGPISALGVWQWGAYTMTAGNDEGIYLVHNPMVSTPTGSLYDEIDNALQITAEGDFTYAACKDELVILRHYESGGATFWENTTEAISIQINPPFGDGELTTATFEADDFIQGASSITYYLSADNGIHWEEVENGVPHSFTNRGDELLWKAEITSLTDATPRIYEVRIEYTYNLRPGLAVLEPIKDKFIGSFKATWAAATDDVGVDHYQIQVADSIGFTNILVDKTTSRTSKLVTVGATGTVYVRVRAVDGEGLAGLWSLEQFNIGFSTWIFAGIIGGAALLITGIIAIIILVSKKKKAIPTR
jgi:hypothetical protein